MAHDALNAAVSAKVREAVTEVWPGDFVVDFVMIGEVIDADSGRRMPFHATSEDIGTVQVTGLLQYGLHMQQAAVVAVHLASGD